MNEFETNCKTFKNTRNTKNLVTLIHIVDCNYYIKCGEKIVFRSYLTEYIQDKFIYLNFFAHLQKFLQF